MGRGTIRSALVLGALTAIVLSVGTAVAAGPVLDRAGLALRQDPVYVDADAQASLSAEDAERVRDEVRAGTHPVYVAVLPASVVSEVGGQPNDVVTALRRSTGLRGTYAVLVGTSFRAGSDVLPGGDAAALATQVFREHRDEGPGAVLREYVSSVQRLETSAVDRPAVGGQEAPAGGDARDGEGSDGGGTSVLPFLLVGGAAAGGGVLLWRRRQKERERQRELDDLRADLRLDLQLLADDVMALEPQVALHSNAREDYEAGAARYRWAQVAVDAIDSPDDVPRIRRALAEGQYAFGRARAHIDGREPPPPPPELGMPGPRGEPAVEIDEQGRPAYAGFGGGWYGGGFFGGSDLFTGLLIGQMLGGGWGWGGGGGYDRGNAEGREGAAQDGGGDGGDPGGGDFGGGDFGGGDFGGGDFGGGDFGGGFGGDFGGGDIGGGDW